MSGARLVLSPQRQYIVIDAEYAEEIRDYVRANPLSPITPELLREEVFRYPLTSTPFALWTAPMDGVFQVEKVRLALGFDGVSRLDLFDVDTGLLLLIRPEALQQLLQKYSFADLVSGEGVHPFNDDYWKVITKNIDSRDAALVFAPGLNSGFDFVGGGQYFIQQ